LPQTKLETIMLDAPAFSRFGDSYNAAAFSAFFQQTLERGTPQE
jgi:hypothetical protein